MESAAHEGTAAALLDRYFAPQPLTPMQPKVLDALRGRTVLLTGAAGSIGSELARQLASAQVCRLVLADRDENGIFELAGQVPKPTTQAGAAPESLIPPAPEFLITDLQNRTTVDHLFARTRPHLVLHAAAYKHVGLMEAQPCEAVRNNLTATRIVAEAAIRYGAAKMVALSTDKAVQPASVMGATKAAAELLLRQVAARQPSTTAFASVRFGNVLGSRGSVLPVFLRQIERGGPITLTDPAMTRFFMTVGDAVRLVLAAAILPGTGQTYVLRMDAPVGIADLAHALARRMAPGRAIACETIGRRPGEKLHERLWSDDETVEPTSHPDVLQVRSVRAGSALLQPLEDAAQQGDDDAVRHLLRSLPIGYTG